jgi:predicted N-acetyltransferase YhbS
VRATVDRAGLDSQGRLSKVQIRRVKKGDLSRIRDVIEQTFADFLERQLGTRPRQAFGGAQYVHHRWLMEPWGCFVAEEDGAKIIGTALAVNWGSIGILGPVAVLTNYQNQTIGQQLIRAVEDFFEENKVVLHGAVTYPTSPKHLFLYHRFGYKPKSLTAAMTRVLDRASAGRPPAAVPPAVKLPAARPVSAAVRRYSSLEEAKKKAALARVHRITNAVCRGLDLAKEIEIVDGLALGDTLLLERGKDLVGFAVYHAPGVSEAPAGALYVKFLAIDPQQKKVEHLEQFIAAIEELAHELGLARVILPVYLRYHAAYSTLVRLGYHVDFTMVRMQRGKQEDYEDPTHLVLDDWR